MSEPVKKSQTLLIPSGSKSHLFVVLTEACPEGNILLVSFSTIREERFYDDTCTVESDEHSFIKKPSYIEYRKARIEKESHINKCKESTYWFPHEPVSDKLFKRICKGILDSPHTPKRIKDYYRSNVSSTK
jgi:hypothetical protein